MKTLKEQILESIHYSTDTEHDQYIEIMSEGLDPNEPMVGTFWYNPSRNELFGVYKKPLDDKGVRGCSYGMTTRRLHKDIWKTEYHKLKSKNPENTFPYIGKYEDKPRGRVFLKDGVFDITVGSWIKSGDNYNAIELIKKEFHLEDETTRVVIDSHWDIGCGWDRM